MSAVQEIIISWTAMGMSRKEVAQSLKRSPRTMEWHINNSNNPNCIQKLLGFSDVARLTHYALLTGLAELMPEVVKHERD